MRALVCHFLLCILQNRVSDDMTHKSLSWDQTLVANISPGSLIIGLSLNLFLYYFSTKMYVLGTQKNHLNETVLLSTQNTCFKLLSKKKNTILRSQVFLSGPMTSTLK